MKERYEAPEIEIVEFETEDVITTSSGELQFIALDLLDGYDGF